MISHIETDFEEYFSKTDILIDAIKKSDENRKKLTSLAIVDLVSSFEVFSGRLVRQYIKKYNDKDLTTCQISDSLRLEQSKKILSDLFDLNKHDHKKEKSIKKLIEIQKLWSNGNIYKLDFNPKLPQGKHGEVVVDSLFKKIGISEILSSIKIKSSNQSILDTITYLDVQEFIGSLTAKRNVAIHEGAPLHNSVSVESLEEICNKMKSIMVQMQNRVNEEIDSINKLTAVRDINTGHP